MTKPLSEDSVYQDIGKSAYDIRQLQRRPNFAASAGNGIYAIEVFENQTPLMAGDGAFEWEIPEDLDQAVLLKIETYVTTTSSSGPVQVQVRNETTGHDMLSTKCTIDAGDLNSKDSATPMVVDPSFETVSWGDHLNIDVDAIGTGATGLGAVLFFVPLATKNIAVQGAKGDPGGTINWTGEWDSGTNYSTDDAVSHNGSSYVAITNNTNVEPGVDAGWETDWMLLSEGARYSALEVAISGNGYPLIPGVKTYLSVPFSGTLIESTLLADRVGSLELDIWKHTYGVMPTSGDTIVGGTPPTLTTQQFTTDTSLSGWTTALVAGDVLAIDVVSCSFIIFVTLALRIERNV